MLRLENNYIFDRKRNCIRYNYIISYIFDYKRNYCVVGPIWALRYAPLIGLGMAQLTNTCTQIGYCKLYGRDLTLLLCNFQYRCNKQLLPVFFGFVWHTLLCSVTVKSLCILTKPILLSKLRLTSPWDN